MQTLNLKLYDTLRKDLDLSEEKARHITEAIEETVKEKVKTDINEYNSVFKNDFKALDNKIDKEISRIELKIEQSKNDTIKWVFGMFIALALLILGIYIK